MRRAVFVLPLLLAVLAWAAPIAPRADSAGPGRDFIGTVYVDVNETAFAVPRIELGEALSLPREFRKLTLIYVPPTSTRHRIEEVTWQGARKLAETPDGFPAALEIKGAGDCTVRLTVKMAGVAGGPPLLVDDEFHLNALDVAVADVRTEIEYPGGTATPPVDLNGDFRVDELDLERFWQEYGNRRGAGAYSNLCDWDGSGAVDLGDLVRFVDAYQGWKGRDIGPTYGNGLVIPVAGRPFPIERWSFEVPEALFRAHTEPAGMEGWIEWRTDGTTLGWGPVAAHGFTGAGTHVVSARLFGTAVEETRRLTIYSARIKNFESGRDILENGVTYTFEAETSPPGYEEYVNWFASTKFGTVSPDHGRGPSFTVRFDGTWGTLGSIPPIAFQWLGVQADNAFFNQDQKTPAVVDSFDSGGRITLTLDKNDSNCLAGTELFLRTELNKTQVSRQTPPYVTGQDITTVLLSLGLEGDDPILGHITVSVRSDVLSYGEIEDVVASSSGKNAVASSGDFVSGHSYFDVFLKIHSSALNMDFDTGAVPIRIDAGTITALPPLGSTYVAPLGPVKLYTVDHAYRTWVGWLCVLEHTDEPCRIQISDTPPTWLPEGRVPPSAVGDPGNSVNYTATVTAGAPRKIRFMLSGVSSEPGVCLNYGTETTPDVKFIQNTTVNPPTIFDPPSADGMAIQTKNKVTSATVTVTCYDWGAWGKIQACCLTEADIVCEGYTPKKDFPVDGNGNNVGDAAAQDTGPGGTKLSKDDKDNDPVGDHTDGDHISRYEEYRGFIVNDAHVRTDVTKKDVFIRNNVGNVAGTDLGPSGDFTTPLLTAPVQVIKAGEMDATRKINFNYKSNHIDQPAGVDLYQTAILATNGTGTASCGGGAFGASAITGTLWVPNNEVYCRVCVGLIEGDYNAVDTRVAAGGFPASGVDYVPMENLPIYAAHQPGRTKIGAEIIQYTSSRISDVSLVGNHTVAATLIQVNETDFYPATGVVRIGNELMTYAGREKQTAALSGNHTAAVTTITVNSTAGFPATGAILIDTEVITYTGTTATTFTGAVRGANGSTADAHTGGSDVVRAVLTGVTRGAFGSTAAAHLHLDTVRQRMFYGLTRGVDGTAAATHSGGDAIKSFAYPNDKARQNLGHEAGHLSQLDHTDQTIMHAPGTDCSWTDNGVWHVYINGGAGTNAIDGHYRVKP